MNINELLKNGGLRLDLGCGETKNDGFVGMDKRELSKVDIVHDLEVFPYPLPDECCSMIVGSHIVEHIKPWLTIEFMDELWRIMMINGQLAFSMPYGYSYGFVQDPTHCNPCNEATWQYFDPNFPLYKVYKPLPWRQKHCSWQATGNMEVMMEKRRLRDEK